MLLSLTIIGFSLSLKVTLLPCFPESAEDGIMLDISLCYDSTSTYAAISLMRMGVDSPPQDFWSTKEIRRLGQLLLQSRLRPEASTVNDNEVLFKTSRAIGWKEGHGITDFMVSFLFYESSFKSLAMPSNGETVIEDDIYGRNKVVVLKLTSPID